MLNQQKKHRQHHVWKHYLGSWSVDGRVWVCREGHIFNANTENVAVERHFYKLDRLSDGDIALLRLLLDGPRHLATKKADNELYFLLMAPVQFVDQNRDRVPNIEQVEEYLDTHLTNVLEDYHAGIEDRFVPTLDRLRNGDLTFLKDLATSIQFFHFVGTQYLRTKGVKERSIQAIQEKNGVDISRIWPILSVIYGRDVGLSLYLERVRRKIVFVQNHTSVPYITGDQPIINLAEKPTERFSLYYPIKPHLALLLLEIGEEPSFSTQTLTAEQVAQLNERIALASHSQVFADCQAALSPVGQVPSTIEGSAATL